MYLLLAGAFFLSCALALVLLVSVIRQHHWWKSAKAKHLKLAALTWFGLYAAFILLACGPEDLSIYPSPTVTPYSLPWAKGDSRFVAQGNRSFTSHRSDHHFAWDFAMPLGTPILAARAGKVLEIEDSLDGIGEKANFITVLHPDGQRSVYAHIQKRSSLVRLNDEVQQGTPIARCGMVGQTLFPHLHFYVLGESGTQSIPVSFREVPDHGVPLAGHFYRSENFAK